MIAYPGSYTKNPAVINLQTKYGQNCFDWGRQYDHAQKGVNILSTDLDDAALLDLPRRGRRRPL